MEDVTKIEIIAYLQKKNIAFRETGNNQYVFKICPFCNDTKFTHFYMNQNTGLYHCKKCNTSGNFNKYKEQFGDGFVEEKKIVNNIKFGDVIEKEYKELPQKLADEYANNLFNRDTKFLEYLKNFRGLNEGVIKKYNIGSSGTKISIPIYENGSLVNIRYRQDPDIDKKDGKKYMSELGCKSALFNEDILGNKDIKEIIICEGEFDCMWLDQLGFNAISITLGATSFLNEWVGKLQHLEKIYICYDSDKVGKNGAKMAIEKLGINRCYNIELPNIEGRKKTDITDYFTTDNNKKDDFLLLMINAKFYGVKKEERVKHISEFTKELRNVLVTGGTKGIMTGYSNIDEEMNGFLKGRLVIVAGLTNSGKSSFSANICLNLAMRNIPSMFFSLEMPPIDIAKKLLMQKAGLSSNDLDIVKESSDMLQKVDETISVFGGLPIYLYNDSGVVGYKSLEKSVREAKEKYKVEIVFVDHLGYFAKSSKNITAEISQIVRQIKQLAMELDIIIVLLAHLNRGGRKEQRTGMYIPTLADLKDASSIEQDADQVLFVCRDSESANAQDRSNACIKCAKNRDGKAGWFASLFFNAEIASFLEIATHNGVEVSNNFVGEEVVTLDSLIENDMLE